MGPEGRLAFIVILWMPTLRLVYSYPAVEPFLHFSPVTDYNLKVHTEGTIFWHRLQVEKVIQTISKWLLQL